MNEIMNGTSGSVGDMVLTDTMHHAGYLKRSGMNELTEDAMRAAMDNGRRYYMILPRKFLFRRGIRILLMFFVSVMVCWNLLTAAAPPMFLYSGMKYYFFVRELSAVNVSSKKMYTILTVWLLICIVINIVFWNWLESIW